MPVSIRSATPADVPTILQFIHDLATYEKMDHEVEATEESLQQTLFGPRPFAECVLAFLDDQVGGFAIYFHNFSTFLAKPGLYLEDLYVKPEFRGEGLGQALITHVATLANQRHCGRMEWSVLDWNQSAIEFYESLGAERMEEWTTCRLSGPALARYL